MNLLETLRKLFQGTNSMLYLALLPLLASVFALLYRSKREPDRRKKDVEDQKSKAGSPPKPKEPRGQDKVIKPIKSEKRSANPVVPFKTPGEILSPAAKIQPTKSINGEGIETRPTLSPKKESDTREKLQELLIAQDSKIVLPEAEEQNSAKFIGYDPVNIFAQSEPLNFPYVVMPKANCIIKFPRKGRTGRKGFKEDSFKSYIDKHFKEHLQVYNDRFILVKNSSKPYEPDFTLIDENNGLNLFIDIEIDEPYEGINDISKRKATHFQGSDRNRNNAFKNRGWIIIRFAEIQVHYGPEACCRFIADVIKSLNPGYHLPTALISQKPIQSLKQWTKEQAEAWSVEKYREKYLGITSFGTKLENESVVVSETDLGSEIEERVEDDTVIIDPLPLSNKFRISNNELIIDALRTGKFLSFTFGNKPTITRPINCNNSTLKAFCYVKNIEKTFNLLEITNLNIKDSYYITRIPGPRVAVEQVSNILNMAISYNRHVRMKYTRTAWSVLSLDEETGELIQEGVNAEESIRTISNVQLSINALADEHIRAYNLNSYYITAYCNKREEQRTFKFDRIGEIEILDI